MTFPLHKQQMSTASKITLGLSCVFACGSFVFINYSQEVERQALREGPIKDAARLERIRENKKLMRNDIEHREQMMLKEKYESVQPLLGDVIEGKE